MTPAGPRLSVIIVAWVSSVTVERCVASLAAARAAAHVGEEALELVIVDNGCPALDEQRLRFVWPDLLLIRNPTNVGYGPATNQGVEASRGELVLLLNPDTRAIGDPFSLLLAAFDACPDVVAVAPRLLDGDETPAEERQDVFQLRHLPTAPQALRELLLIDKGWPHNRWRRRDRYLNRDRTSAFAVEQPAASALAIRRSAFERLNGFDECFVPAWFEDIDLCKRLLPIGRILFLPTCSFVHEGGEAAHQLGYEAFLTIFYRNAHRYWRKHHGFVGAAAFRALVAVGMVLRLLVLPLRRRLPRARGEAARAYLRALRGATGIDRTFAIPRSLQAHWSRPRNQQ